MDHFLALNEHAAHEVSTGVTLLFTFILLALIICLALEEKIHAKKSLIAGVFAVVCLLLGEVFHLMPSSKMLFNANSPLDDIFLTRELSRPREISSLLRFTISKSADHCFKKEKSPKRELIPR